MQLIHRICKSFTAFFAVNKVIIHRIWTIFGNTQKGNYSKKEFEFQFVTPQI